MGKAFRRRTQRNKPGRKIAKFFRKGTTGGLTFAEKQAPFFTNNNREIA